MNGKALELIIGQTNGPWHSLGHWGAGPVEDSIRAAGNKPPTEVWEAVKRETKAGTKAQQEHREFCRVSYLGAAQTRFQTQKHRETNRMASQGLKLALPGTSSARKKPAPGKARKNSTYIYRVHRNRTFHGLTCIIDHPESWQEDDEEDLEFAKALQASREQQRKDEDERDRQEIGSTTAIRIMKMVNFPSPARHPDSRGSGP